MQKKIIALAIASLSGVAFAQSSNVTIYGVADATFDVIGVSGGSAALKANTPSFTRVSTNGSRLGVKGTENLGNGLTALFQFESNANFDTGGALGTSRDSFVGLSGDFGRIILGNLSGPSRTLTAKLDVNAGNDGIGTNYAIVGKLGGALARGGAGYFGGTYLAPTAYAQGKNRSETTSSLFDTRFHNTIAYITPTLSGLQATLAYVANENKSDAAGAKVNSTGYDLGLTYTNGPLFIGATYAQVKDRNAVSVAGLLPAVYFSGDAQATEWRLGGLYDFGVATLRLFYGHTKGEDSNGDATQNVWGLGGTYNVTANGKLTAQYYTAGDLNISSGWLGGGSDKDTGARFFSLGYEHSLSKRTLLKANYAYLKNDDKTSSNGFGGYDFGKNSSGFAGDELKLSGLQVGLRHSF